MPDQESKMSTSMSSMKETRQRASAPKQDNVVPEASSAFVETPFMLRTSQIVPWPTFMWDTLSTLQDLPVPVKPPWHFTLPQN